MSYLNFPDQLSLKITFVFFPQLLLIESHHMIVPIRKQICNLGMILNAWFCLLTMSFTKGKRILSRRTEKEKITELSWCQKYDRPCDFLKTKSKNSLFKLRHYISLTLNSIKYCPEMHLLFNPISNSIILVKTTNIKIHRTKISLIVH